jgi:hypothetical protein
MAAASTGAPNMRPTVAGPSLAMLRAKVKAAFVTPAVESRPGPKVATNAVEPRRVGVLEHLGCGHQIAGCV